MSEGAIERMGADEFLEWHLAQEQRYELVDGVPFAMAGAKRRHDRVVVNAIAALASQLGAGPCQPFTNDTAVRIPNGNIRYPDAGIDCGIFNDGATWADAPTLVIEVLSESTRAFDLTRKLEEYKTVPSLNHIIFVGLDAPEIVHWRREPARSWESEVIEGLEAVVAMDDLGLRIPLAALYAGLEFQQRFRLVRCE
ncbi:MAG TPA: Uma2 family endonuclease [Acetobacteraceae bacterium]|nr:Uma2 family endonuclease [Acetobacteraceae bacterium]